MKSSLVEYSSRLCKQCVDCMSYKDRISLQPIVYCSSNGRDGRVWIGLSFSTRTTKISTRSVSDHQLDRFAMPSRSACFSISTRIFLTCQKYSGKKPMRCRPQQTIADHPDHETRASPTGLKLIGRGRSS